MLLYGVSVQSGPSESQQRLGGIFLSCGFTGTAKVYSRAASLVGHFNMGSSLNYIGSVFYVPNIVRHPYKKDPQRDPNLENHLARCRPTFIHSPEA